jgi:hypothetical protein
MAMLSVKGRIIIPKYYREKSSYPRLEENNSCSNPGISFFEFENLEEF